MIVYVPDPRVFVQVHVENRRRVLENAGRGNQGSHRPKFALDACGQRHHGIRISNITNEGRRRAAGFVNLRGRSRQSVFVYVNQGDLIVPPPLPSRRPSRSRWPHPSPPKRHPTLISSRSRTQGRIVEAGFMRLNCH